MGRLRIAFIVDSFPAPSETFILNQITALIDLGHQVDIFAMRQAKEPYHADIQRYKLLERTQFLKIPATKKGRFIKLAGKALEIVWRHPAIFFKELNAFRGFGLLLANFEMLQYLESSSKNGAPYDIVHCHYGTLGRQFLLLTNVLPGKYIVNFHGYDLFIYGDRGKEMYQQLFAKADGFIANTDYMAEALVALGCQREKILKLPSALDLDKFIFRTRSLEPGSTIRLLTVARLVEIKGIEYSIKAVARLAHRYSIQYQIVGEGRERDHLENLIKQLDLEDKVFLLGTCTHEDVIGLLNKAHIFVLASVSLKNGRQDNGPNVLKEAQASGIPVVATNSGAIPEILDDGRSGFLVPERDVEALAEKLEYLITHPEIWPEMGKAGRKYAEEHFDTKIMRKRFEQLYFTA